MTRMSVEDRDRGRRGVLVARLALAEARGNADGARVRRLRAELAEFDAQAEYQAKHRIVNSGRLPYRDDTAEVAAS